MSLLRKPVVWVVLAVLGWLALVTVQIALGMGTGPETGTPAGR